MDFDRIIYNGTLVTVNPGFEIIDDGIVAIRDGMIAWVGPRSKEITQYPAADVVDAAGGIVMPGLVNCHTHLPMSLFRGLADDLPLETWLNHYIFPAEQHYLSPETVRTGTLLSCAEMLMSGTTCCCDGYFYENNVAAAVQETGIRAVLAQGVIDFPAPGVPDPALNVAAAVDFVEKWKDRSPLITPSVFCHSPYTCSPETLQNAKNAATAAGALFQIHVAETKAEVARMRDTRGMSPVQFLDSLGVLDENTLVAHGVWVDKADITLLADRQVRMVHCPESNMKLASGIAPVPEMIRKGIPVGLGTDGCASNNNLDVFEEMDVAAKLHKVAAKDPTIMNAETVIRMATIEGARAAGLGDVTGSLEIGKQADIIIIDTAKPHLTPVYHPASHLVYAVSGADVSDVFVGGKTLMRNYQLKTLDVQSVMAEARKMAAAIAIR